MDGKSMVWEIGAGGRRQECWEVVLKEEYVAHRSSERD